METTDFNDAGLVNLAAVHARLGETERAVELLRRILRQGRFPADWELVFQLASAPPLESEAYDEFLEEYEAEEQRLREMY